ncbi:MAG: EutN/CcmL family microcompartment protein [Planctomycetia bacterium]|nr:EutN/CcmL family microcompartment protein [Planctomycetia bacterium]
MRIGKVLGSVTLCKAHPTMLGGAFKVVVPYTLDDLRKGNTPSRTELVVYDEFSAAEGQMIGLGEGREAVNPFYPDHKPVDAYGALILDQINVDF